MSANGVPVGLIHSVVVGAAGYQPDQAPPGVYRVLLLPDLAVYNCRRALRDLEQPSKRDQGDYYSEFARELAKYHFVLRHSSTPDEDLLLIVQRFLDWRKSKKL